VQFEMDRGKIKVDKYMETSVKGIYAPGDVNGLWMLAHTAFRMGEVAAENAVKGNHREANLHSAPSVSLYPARSGDGGPYRREGARKIMVMCV